MTYETIVKETTKDGHVRALIRFSGKWTARAAEDRIAGLPVEDLYEDSGSVFAVGKFLAINVYSDEVYGEILAALDGNPTGQLHKVTPETAMFDLMGKIDFSKLIPKDTEKKIKGIANLFFQSWLKEATIIGLEASDNVETVKWVEAWFNYKGKKYHLDFCMEDGNNTLCLYTTNKYQENVDCAYVTVDTLQEKIDSVDDTGHFPENTKVEPEAPEANPRENSMEERLGKVEAAIAVLKEEVADIKKKL